MKKFFGVVAVSAWLTIGVWNVVQATPLLITDGNDVSLAGSTVLDFNSETNGSFTTRTFGGFVTLSSTQNLYVSSEYNGYYGMTGTHISNITNPEPFRIDFAEDVSAFGFKWGAADQPWTMSLFNDNTGFLGSLNIAAQSNPYIGFIGGKDSSSSISYAIMTDLSSYNYDYFLLDNFEYVKADNSAPVPEPGTMALLGLGMAGLAIYGKRRQNNKA